MTVQRNEKGQLLPGSVLNPRGRPRAPFSVRDMLRVELEQRPEVVRRILTLCASEDEQVALRAILGLVNWLEPASGDKVTVSGDGAQVLIVRGGPSLGMAPEVDDAHT